MAKNIQVFKKNKQYFSVHKNKKKPYYFNKYIIKFKKWGCT